MSQLPSSRALFDRYFLMEYQPRDRQRLGKEYPRLEIAGAQEWVGKTGADVSHITEESQAEIGQIIDSLLDHAEATWEHAFGHAEPFTLQGIEAFDRVHTAQEIDKVLGFSDPLNANNEYLIRCSLLGAVLGQTIIDQRPGAQWVYDYPLWESAVLDPSTGAVVPVFHWAVHRMSADGVEESTTGRVTVLIDLLARIKDGTSAAHAGKIRPQPGPPRKA